MPRIIDWALSRHLQMGLIGLMGLVGSGWAITPTKVILDEAGQGTVQSTIVGPVSALQWADGAPTDWVSSTTLSWQSNPTYTVVTWALSDRRLAEQYAELPLQVMHEGQRVSETFVVDPMTRVIGPVASGTTLWRIAEVWRGELGEQSPSMPQLIERLMDANPHAFERDDPTGLLAGAMLRLPSIESAIGNSGLRDQANRSLQQDDQTRAFIPVPWRTLGTRAWIETTMVRAVVDARTNRQAWQGAQLSNDPTSESVDLQRQPKFNLVDRIQGRWVFVAFLVVAVMLVLHGFSRMGATASGTQKAQQRASMTLSPEAAATTLALAEQYLRLGDPAQALYWLEEVMASVDAKQVRSAKKLWREAQALFDLGAFK